MNLFKVFLFCFLLLNSLLNFFKQYLCPSEIKYVYKYCLSYILGIFTGLIIIDAFYSFKLYSKIKKYAKENNIIIKYEQLKIDIKEFQKSAREKYSFLNPFNQTKPLKNYLNLYKEKTKKQGKFN